MIPCSRCEGSGEIYKNGGTVDEEGPWRCPACDGSGVSREPVEPPEETDPPDPENWWEFTGEQP